jgi:predicted metal-dependent phosphoesterase TrpH
MDPLRPPTPSRADFHAHTIRSDGLLAPAELAAQAAAAGVRALAIADHETLAAHHELRQPGAAPLPAGLRVIAGVEIAAAAGGMPGLADAELHLVGLGVDPDDDALEGLLAAQRATRRRRFELMRARLRVAGMPVDAQLEAMGVDSRPGVEALGRPTLARALVAAGHAATVDDAFARLIGRGGPGYVPREPPTPREVIGAITAAGGIPVLAHCAAAADQPALVDGLVELGLRGIEVHHRSFGAAVVEAMAKAARRHGLLPSGGTDFHGDEGTYAEAIAETWVPDDVAAGVLAALDAGSARHVPLQATGGRG